MAWCKNENVMWPAFVLTESTLGGIPCGYSCKPLWKCLQQPRLKLLPIVVCSVASRSAKLDREFLWKWIFNSWQIFSFTARPGLLLGCCQTCYSSGCVLSSIHVSSNLLPWACRGKTYSQHEEDVLHDWRQPINRTSPCFFKQWICFCQPFTFVKCSSVSCGFLQLLQRWHGLEGWSHLYRLPVGPRFYSDSVQIFGICLKFGVLFHNLSLP